MKALIETEAAQSERHARELRLVNRQIRLALALQLVAFTLAMALIAAVIFLTASALPDALALLPMIPLAALLVWFLLGSPRLFEISARLMGIVGDRPPEVELPAGLRLMS